jgi:hypothetical protein
MALDRNVDEPRAARPENPAAVTYVVSRPRAVGAINDGYGHIKGAAGLSPSPALSGCAHEFCACKRRDRRIVSSLARRARDLVLNLNVKNVRVAVLRATD